MKTNSQEVPPQFSGLMGMGAPIEVFKTKSSLVLQIILTGILFLVLAGSFLYSLSQLWERWGRWDPMAIFKDMLPFLLIAGVAFILGLAMVIGIFRSRKKAAVVYANGFAYSDHKGVQTWKWEQIQDVYANVVRHYTNGIYTGTTHSYTLYNPKGGKLVLNDTLKNIENLYSHVEENTLQLRYQRLADSYNAGNAVQFGPVTLSKANGILMSKKSYPWEEIEQVAINNGFLSVKKKGGGWFSGASASAGAIPNLHVLLSIIDQVVGLKTGK